MKSRRLTVSTANIAVGVSYQMLNVFLMVLLSTGMDPKFEKPFVWIILGSFPLIMCIYIIRKYTLNIEMTESENINNINFKNPLVLWCILVLFKKVNVKAITLTGKYEYFHENNKMCITQINTPNIVDYLKDIMLLLCTLGILIVCYIFLSKVNIFKYGLAVVFCFVYTSIFIEKLLSRWCYLKFSFQFEKKVRVSPLLYNKHIFAIFSANRVILNSQIPQFDEDIIKYIIEHERGHIKSFDYIKRLIVDICIFLLGLIFCYLQIVNLNISYLALIAMMLIFLLQIPLVLSIELSADAYAAKKLGIDLCIQALKDLKLYLVSEEKQVVDDVYWVSGLIQMFRGSVSIERKIKHLKSLGE